jgi:hypothetical protein
LVQEIQLNTVCVLRKISQQVLLIENGQLLAAAPMGLMPPPIKGHLLLKE